MTRMQLKELVQGFALRLPLSKPLLVTGAEESDDKLETANEWDGADKHEKLSMTQKVIFVA